MPTALVHDWLMGMRGGEWLLSSLLRLLPRAPVHTLFYRPGKLARSINQYSIRPGMLSRLPGVPRYYRWLLPMLPMAVERLKLGPDLRLVLSVSHCVAHGARAPEGSLHVNYCLSPMRYLYDQSQTYVSAMGPSSAGLRWAAPRLRKWDAAAAARVDQMWAISRFVADRIERVWGVKSRVIYPPARTGRFVPPPDGTVARKNEYLLVSAMVPYKRVDLAIRAANRLHMPLRVVGDGPLLARMRRLAGSTVAVEGRVDEERLAELYRTRSGLIFPAEEDFGIVPLEAMASGMPVLGLRAGGLLETHLEHVTGEYFDEPTVESLAEAWTRFKPENYTPAALRHQAERFSEERFLAEVAGALLEILH